MKYLKYSFLFLALLVFCLGVFPAKSSAVSTSGFKAGRIIDDAVFYNPNAMNTTQIQNFLNSKVPNCDSGYTCLKSYKQNTPAKAGSSLCGALGAKSNRSAAGIINDVAHACGISQKALVVLLQKEQGLVTDTHPSSTKFKKATGYACPDTAPCDSQYFGFFNQVYNAAKQFKRYQANPDNYNFEAGLVNSIQYNPNAGCGSSNVLIKNQATAGLYNYTPYQPNQAALNAGYGTAPCGAYGNRNFWLYFNDWFGSTQTNTPYAWRVEAVQAFSNSTRTKKFTSTPTVVPNGTVYARVQARNMGYQDWDSSFVKMGTYNPGDRTSTFQDSSWLGNTRPAALSESTVPPGDLGTFDFVLKAPSTRGAYKESFNGLAEGRTWFADGNVDFSINVTDVRSADSTDYLLSSGEKLLPGKYLLSQDRQSILMLQTDGNLVHYRNFKPVWSSNTAGTKPGYLMMQTDGNLVLYGLSGLPLWHTATYGNNGSVLSLQTDSNLVVYHGSTPVWYTGIGHNPNLLGYVNTSLSTASLFKGQVLETPDHKYKLVLQDDGNLVLYKNGSTPLWNSRTVGKTSLRLALQADGNLVLYDKNNHALWHTRTMGRGYSTLVIQGDGNLVLYPSSGKPSWNSETNNK